MRLIALALVVVAAVSACGAGPVGERGAWEPPSEPTSTANRQDPLTTVPSADYGDGRSSTPDTSPPLVKPTAPVEWEDGAVIEAGLENLIDQAVSDLAHRLNVPGAEIIVVSAESVIWSDGSIGCPQPDMLYTQVEVDGARIVLRFGEAAYPYHSGGPLGLFLCN